MPYIEVKLAKQASRKQERILTEKLGEAITSVPGKTAAGLMVSISSDEHIYKGGEFLEYGAYVNVVFKTGVTRADCEKFNEAIFTIMEEDLKYQRRMYIRRSSIVMTLVCRVSSCNS